MTLKVRDLGVSYGTHSVVRSLDIDVADGEIVAILGASGSGKSSVLRAICGLVPSEGSVLWNNEKLHVLPPHRRQIGLMFQDHALFDHMTVADNIGFGLKMHGVARRDRAALVVDWLGAVGLKDFEARRISSLSGGEQQRVALARALAPTPRALLLDEPFGALDPTLRRHLVQEVRELVRRQRIAAVLVTHDHDEAFVAADRVAVLIDGAFAQIDAPADLWQRPASLAVCEELGFEPPLRGVADGTRVDFGWGVLEADRCAPRGAIDVVLRPDAFRIDSSGPLTATVRSVTPLGDRLQALVEINDGPSVRVDAAMGRHVGELVRLSVRRDAVLCY